MTTWDSLLTTALLGTERRSLQVSDDAPALLHRLDAMDAEQRLLAAAGIMAVYRRAGYTPQTDDSALLTPAPEERLAPCSIRSTHRLMTMLAHPQKYRLFLGEWLLITGQKHKRVPHSSLPAVLDELRREKTLLPLILPVLGERGKWLAAQNSDWNKVLQRGAAVTSVKALHTLLSDEPPDPGEIRVKEEQALASLKSRKPIRETGALELLAECRHVWSDKLVEAFVNKLLKEGKDKPSVIIYDDYAPVLALSLPRRDLDSVIQRLSPRDDDEKRPFYQALIALLKFRRDMLQELSRE